MRRPLLLLSLLAAGCNATGLQKGQGSETASDEPVAVATLFQPFRDALVRTTSGVEPADCQAAMLLGLERGAAFGEMVLLRMRGAGSCTSITPMTTPTYGTIGDFTVDACNVLSYATKLTLAPGKIVALTFKDYRLSTCEEDDKLRLTIEERPVDATGQVLTDAAPVTWEGRLEEAPGGGSGSHALR